MRRFLILLLCLPTVVWAEDVVRYTGTTYLSCGHIGDTTVFLTNPNDYSTIKPGFIYLPNGCDALLPGVPDKYRKISGGVVVEMTQAERDSVDAPILAAQARQAALAGHIHLSGTAPVVSACGTTPANVGVDSIGRITVGTGVVTSCTLTFSTSWVNAPLCLARSSVGGAVTSTETTTAVTFTTAVSMGGATMKYLCLGND